MCSITYRKTTEYIIYKTNSVYTITLGTTKLREWMKTTAVIKLIIYSLLHSSILFTVLFDYQNMMLSRV